MYRSSAKVEVLASTSTEQLITADVIAMTQSIYTLMVRLQPWCCLCIWSKISHVDTRNKTNFNVYTVFPDENQNYRPRAGIAMCLCNVGCNLVHSKRCTFTESLAIICCTMGCLISFSIRHKNLTIQPCHTNKSMWFVYQ